MIYLWLLGPDRKDVKRTILFTIILKWLLALCDTSCGPLAVQGASVIRVLQILLWKKTEFFPFIPNSLLSSTLMTPSKFIFYLEFTLFLS